MYGKINIGTHYLYSQVEKEIFPFIILHIMILLQVSFGKYFQINCRITKNILLKMYLTLLKIIYAFLYYS